ncbi:MAG TPA: hypothetical protein VG943_16495 [Caulobacterales bacterium]|nr:hypothetical protein [Caulobacterales bacterium]
MKRFILGSLALAALATPALADGWSRDGGDFSRAYGMDESFANPIDPSTRDANGQRILGPSPLEGTLSGGLMDSSQSPGSYQVVGQGRFVVVTLNDGRTVTIDTTQQITNPNDTGDVSADMTAGDQ